MTTGLPASTWTETLSCRFEPAPTVIDALSPRSTALYQTLDCTPSRTSPITRAPAARNADSSISGLSPAMERTDAASEFMP